MSTITTPFPATETNQIEDKMQDLEKQKTPISNNY